MASALFSATHCCKRVTWPLENWFSYDIAFWGQRLLGMCPEELHSSLECDIEAIAVTISSLQITRYVATIIF